MFTFPVDPAEVFEERARQFEGWGIPSSIVEKVRTQVRDMWSEEDPSGWVPAWAEWAERAEREGRWLQAALLWGAARFPCFATPGRRAAYERQLAGYERASADFPVRFERLVLDVPFDGGQTPVPVHLFRRRRAAGRSLVALSGGVDTWKVELHRLAVATARATGLTVAALDMPGTGESRVPLSPDSDRVLAGAIGQLARLERAERTGFFGISFGGHWAAKLALTGRVDAAVDLGGPVGADPSGQDVTSLPYGMTGIVAHALGLEEPPSPEDADELVEGFSLGRQGLLDVPAPAPLLAVNGERDQYIPAADTTVFASHPNATVWVVKGATHCAAERARRVIPASLGWLTARLSGGRPLHRFTEAVLRLPLRPLLADLSGGAKAPPRARGQAAVR
jgi:esterase FrsA